MLPEMHRSFRYRQHAFYYANENIGMPTSNIRDAQVNRQAYATYRGSTPANTAGNPFYPDTASQFNAENYNAPAFERDEQRGVRNSQARTRAVGTTMQATGMAMNLGGKATKQTGKGIARAGAALSTTGVGAIVGVPLAIAGKGVSAAGSGIEQTGKITSKIGKNIKRKNGAKLKPQNALAVISSAKNILNSASLLVLVVKIWVTALIPVNILSLVFLASFIGIPIFIVFLVLHWIIALCLIVFILVRHASIGIFPISGSNAEIKIAILLGCILGHLLPLVNFIPWILIYVIYTALYPR